MMPVLGRLVHREMVIADPRISVRRNNRTHRGASMGWPSQPFARRSAVISVHGYAHLHIIRGDLLRFFASPHAQKHDMHDSDKKCLLNLREVFAVSLREIAQRRFDSADGVRLQIIRILCFV